MQTSQYGISKENKQIIIATDITEQSSDKLPNSTPINNIIGLGEGVEGRGRLTG
jgi:hypothetical protein